MPLAKERISGWSIGVWLGVALGCGPAARPVAAPAPSGAPGASAAVPLPPVPPEVWKQRLDESRRRLGKEEAFRKARISSLGFEDDASGLCVAPLATNPAEIDVARSLWIHDRATLDWNDPAPPAGVPANFSLKSTLGQLASQVPTPAPGVSATGLFAELWDTQNADGVGAGAHCTDNGGLLNGFEVKCREKEGLQAANAATEIGKYW